MSGTQSQIRQVRCPSQDSPYVSLNQTTEMVGHLRAQVKAVSHGNHEGVALFANRAEESAINTAKTVRLLDCEWEGTTDVMVHHGLAIWTCPRCGSDNETEL